MESHPTQTVRGCWGSSEQCPSYLLSPGWPGEKSRVLAEGVQLHPLIIWPYDVLETHSFLQVVGDMSGYPTQETILMAHQHPGQGGGQSEKLRFFGDGKVTWDPLPTRPLMHYPNGHMPGVAAHLSNTPLKAAKI